MKQLRGNINDAIRKLVAGKKDHNTLDLLTLDLDEVFNRVKELEENQEKLIEEKEFLHWRNENTKADLAKANKAIDELIEGK